MTTVRSTRKKKYEKFHPRPMNGRFFRVIFSTVTTSTSNRKRDLFTTKAEKHEIDINTAFQQFRELTNGKKRRHDNSTTHKSSIVEANNQKRNIAYATSYTFHVQLWSQYFAFGFFQSIGNRCLLFQGLYNLNLVKRYCVHNKIWVKYRLCTHISYLIQRSNKNELEHSLICVTSDWDKSCNFACNHFPNAKWRIK